jgi:tetratricopeptide (TPR) repeat protein
MTAEGNGALSAKLPHFLGSLALQFALVSPTGYICRAAAQVMREDLAGAETDLKKSIELAPNSPLPYARLGRIRFDQKRWNEAEMLFDQALEMNPNYAGAL